MNTSSLKGRRFPKSSKVSQFDLPTYSTRMSPPTPPTFKGLLSFRMESGTTSLKLLVVE